MTVPASKRKKLPAKYATGFLQTLDRRTEIATRLNANFDRIADECGGREALSHVKAALVERFVFLEAVMQGIETEIATNPANGPALIGSWVQSLNAMVGLAKTLGIERKVRDLPALADYVRKGRSA